MSDDAEAIGEHSELVGITEMSVDVELFGVGAGGGMGRHEAISHAVGVNIGPVLVVSLEFSDEGIKCFGVIFGDIEFNAGGVKGKHFCEGRVDQVADGFGKIYQQMEHLLNKDFKVLFKAGQERCIGDFGEAAEVADFLTEP